MELLGSGLPRAISAKQGIKAVDRTTVRQKAFSMVFKVKLNFYLLLRQNREFYAKLG
jgi:hypothetical protein